MHISAIFTAYIYVVFKITLPHGVTLICIRSWRRCSSDRCGLTLGSAAIVSDVGRNDEGELSGGKFTIHVCGLSA